MKMIYQPYFFSRKFTEVSNIEILSIPATHITSQFFTNKKIVTSSKLIHKLIRILLNEWNNFKERIECKKKSKMRCSYDNGHHLDDIC